MQKKYIIFALLYFVSTNKLRANNQCSEEFIHTEKNLNQIYNKIRTHSARCNFSADLFLQFAEKTILAEHFSEALWSSNMGISQLKAKNGNIYYLLLLAKGEAYLGLKRYEESISTLKIVAFSETIGTNISEKAHLSLINAYFKKKEDQLDKNVIFLVNLFLTRYPESRFSENLYIWFKRLEI